MSGRTELLAYLTTSIGTVVALFVLQQLYRGHLDVSYHEAFAERPANADLAALRAEEAQKRSGLESAKKALAERGRGANAKISPKPSTDLSAMNGWIHRPGFGPYTPRKPEPTAAPPSAEVPVEAAPAQGAEAPAGAEAGAAPEQAAPATGEGQAEGAAAPPRPVTGVTVEASGQVPAARPVRPAAAPPAAPAAAVPTQVGPATTAPAGR